MRGEGLVTFNRQAKKCTRGQSYVLVLVHRLLLKKMASFSRRALRLAKDRAILTLLPRRSLSYPREPLTQPVSGLPSSSSSSASHAQQRDHIESAALAETKVTELENGLRVASQEAFGQYSTIGGEANHAMVRIN